MPHTARLGRPRNLASTNVPALFGSAIVLAAVCSSFSGTARGQSPGAGSTAGTGPGSAVPPDIVVTGQAAAATSSIDRKTYRIANDLQAASGSASDVLRNLPAVEVDAQGALSIRGDPNVQVLIDGKPSTTMSSANRADALEQLPANTIDHIEVITNPSARFKPDGPGGIINIVTKTSHKTGTTGSVSASVGSDGRFNLAADATYRSSRLTATGSLTLHRDMRWRPFSDRRTQTDATTGQQTRSAQDSLFHGEKLSRIVAGSIDYDATSSDRLTASGSYNHRVGKPRTDQHDQVIDPAGAIASDFTRSETGHEDEVSDEAAAKYWHNFVKKGRVFTLDLRRGESIENEVRRFTDRYSQPAGLVTIDQQRPRLDLLQREATAEYATPAWGGKLLLGYDLQRDDNDFLDRGETIDPVTHASFVDPTYTNQFTYQQTVHALYSTYDRTLVKGLTAIFGARFEQTFIHTHEVDLGVAGHQSYSCVYPTLDIQYGLSDDQSLKFSYGKRIVRPDPEDLNPFPVFSDPLNERAGNALLKPQVTQALEAGYQYDAHGLSLEATLFLRRTRNGFTTVSRFISPTVLLTTQDNLGRSAATGIDIAASGKLSRVVSWRLSGTLSRNSIDPGNLGFAAPGAILTGTAKGGIDLKLSSRDLVQVSANYNGKRLIAQGYRLPSANVNIGYRRRFREGLTAVLSLSDIFDSQHERRVIDGATFVDDSIRRNSRRTLSFALTMPFGTGRKAAETPFDFGS